MRVDRDRFVFEDCLQVGAVVPYCPVACGGPGLRVTIAGFRGGHPGEVAAEPGSIRAAGGVADGTGLSALAAQRPGWPIA